VTDGIKLLAEVTIGNHDFADDITMLRPCKQRLQELLNKVSEKASHLGLKIYSSKTKTMATADSTLHIKCGNEEIKQVMEFKYVEIIVANMGSAFDEIITGIAQGDATFNRPKHTWKSKNYSTWLKLHLFNSIVILVLLYAAKIWSLRQQQKKRFLALENNCLRRILNIHWLDRIANKKFCKLADQPLVTDIIFARR